MTVLIIFESIEGQTAKIAGAIADQVEAAGYPVRLFNTAGALAPQRLDGVDKVILAAPVHERRHPPTFEAMVSAARADLAARPTLMISVSLKAAFAEWRSEAGEYLLEMKMRTRFDPTEEMLLAGAIRPGSYDYYEQQVLSNVVLEGRPKVSRTAVTEFTDWAALAAKVKAFLDR